MKMIKALQKEMKNYLKKSKKRETKKFGKINKSVKEKKKIKEKKTK